MNDSMVEGLAQVILSLKPAQRRRLVNKIVESNLLTEDEEDQLLIEARKSEPSIPYAEIRNELKRKGRLK
ncbi:MAG TPA: hypothetical protein VM658_17820 [bacterium]|nr:hypothetical protein [bacterium]